MVDFFPEKNKQACFFITDLRVGILKEYLRRDTTTGRDQLTKEVTDTTVL